MASGEKMAKTNMRRVIVLFFTCCYLGMSLAQVVDDADADIIAFFNGNCGQNAMCTEVCMSHQHGYFCKCGEGKVLNADGYSCSDAITTTPTTTTQKPTPSTASPISPHHVSNVSNTSDYLISLHGANNTLQNNDRVSYRNVDSNVLTPVDTPHTVQNNDRVSYRNIDSNDLTPLETPHIKTEQSDHYSHTSHVLKPVETPLIKTGQIDHTSHESHVLKPTETSNIHSNIKITSFDLRRGIPDPLEQSHSYSEVDRISKISHDSQTGNYDGGYVLDLLNIQELGAGGAQNLLKRLSVKCEMDRCKNGGTCAVVSGTTKCDCMLGYRGPSCEEVVEVRYPRFRGDGYIAFPVLRNAYRNFDIQLELRPDSADGLLLFTGEHADARTDFFSVALVGGQIQFRFDCGTGPATISSEGNVTIGAWNTVAVSRREGAGSLKLNNEPAQYGHSQGDFTRITMRENFFLGGHPDMAPLAARVGTDLSFKGCIQHLWVGGYQYDMRPGGLIGDALHGRNVDECSSSVCKDVTCQNGGLCKAKSADSHVCMCVLGTDGHNCEKSGEIHVSAFNGHSYLEYVGLHRCSLTYTEIEIIFKPLHPDGLLMYNGYTLDRKGDFFSLAMNDGHLEFRFDLGTGHGVLRSVEELTLNRWHKARVERTERQAYMYVDQQAPVQGLSRGAFTQMTLLLDLFVGGHKNPDQMSRHVNMSRSFTGCIQKVVINSHPLGLITEALDGVNIGNCDHKCAGVPCLNGGVCVPSHSLYQCNCGLGYTGKHCAVAVKKPFQHPKFTSNSYLKYNKPQILKRVRGSRIDIHMLVRITEPHGLLLWIGKDKMTSSGDYLALGFSDGILEFRYNLGNGEAVITTELGISMDGDASGDAGWYSIRAQRNKQSGYLQVNDRSMVEGRSPGEYTNLDTNTPLYLGGMPDITRNTLNKYITGFNGCIETFKLDSDYHIHLIDMAHSGQNIANCS